MEHETQESSRPIMQAQTLLDMLMQPEDKVVVTLRGITIEGSLNLKHRTVKVAVDIQDCTFLGDVDLNYCEFTQAVDLRNCVFQRRFDSGNELESYTIYQKDLICDGAIFEGSTSFVGIRCGGNAYFKNVRFLQGPVSFDTASFGLSLDCSSAVFSGGASFNSIKCEQGGFFKCTQFENETQEVDFTAASFAGSLECADVVFKGGVTFNSVRCEGTGFFNNAHFENTTKDIDLAFASFAIGLDCRHAMFKGGASFSSVRCEGIGFFDDTHFENTTKDIDFAFASFAILECIDAVFKGGVTFNSIRCEGTGFFNNTHFENTTKDIDLAFASFASGLHFRDAVFKGGASFANIDCKAPADFANAKFMGELTVNFIYAHFGRNLDLPNAVFSGAVDLESVQIDGSLNLSGARFQGWTSLQNASIRHLEIASDLQDKFPFADKSLDLRGCRFDTFGGTKHQAVQFAAAQSQDKFTRDPYVQLEKYYTSLANDADASYLYYKGRCAERESANRQGSSAHWSRSKYIGDWFLKVLTGYGVRTWRLLLLSLTVVCIGTGIFWGSNALIPSEAATTTTYTASSTGPMAALLTLARQGEADPLGKKLFVRTGYSLDLFLPVLDLGIVDRWQPQPLWREMYMTIHVMLGWLMVPLLVASLSGIVRSSKR